MFGNKCKHQWEEISNTYTQSAHQVESVERGNSAVLELLRELEFGRTNIKLRCSECGDVQFRSVIGKA